MNVKKEEEFVTSLKRMLAMLPEPPKKVRVDKKVSGTILFSQDKVFVFGLKGGPEQNVMHAIVNRGNNMIVGLFFSSEEHIISDELRYNVLYRLQPFVFSNYN